MEKYYGITIFEWIFLCMVFFLGIWYLIIQISYPKITAKTSKKLDFNTLTNGDLLFTSGNSRGEKTCKWFTSSRFSHVSMVFQENGVWYTIDCDVGGNHHKDGVRITKLSDKLARKGLNPIVGLRKYRGDPISNTTIMEIYKKYKDVDFDNKMWTWFTSRWRSLHSYFSNPKKMFCSEFIAVLLGELGILDMKKYGYPPSDFSPSSFYNNNIVIPYDEMIYLIK